MRQRARPNRGGRLLVVGDTLLDRDLDGRVERLCPDAPVPVVDDPVAVDRPGGAGLAALLAAADGLEVTLVTALSDDDAGRRLAELLGQAGVDVAAAALHGPTPRKVRVRGDGRSLLRLDYGGRRAPVGALPAAARRRLETAPAAVLVSDYGRGMAAQPEVRGVLEALAPRRPVVWDPHPRGAEPVAGVRLATPNRAEAAGLVPDVAGDGLPAVVARAHELVARWSAGGVAVTLGARGALLAAADGTALLVPAPAVVGGDTCGAGDRFAARTASALARGLLVSEAVVEAVDAASAFVAAGGAAAIARGARRPASADSNVRPGRRRPAALALVEQVRAARGTVVATGGCFDLLHAGHVQTLAAARRLGDCLIVCLNSDASVRRLKGPDRPLVSQDDRAAVLDALACVDAVAVFDENTPAQILQRLRPDVWVKGADYAVGDLPEAALVASWGGQTVVLPYLPGRSTTRLIQEATHRDPR